MNYESFILELFSRRKGRASPEDLKAFAKAIGDPQNAFSSIHIVGSNGKGSVATKIARGLEAAGRKVGLFTSPHLLCYEERIQVNGEQIQREEVLHRGKRLLERCSWLNFFEVTTFMAFEYFRDQGVEIAVIEAGLGGARDATNIITPILTVITSISLEHTDVLGSSLQEIAHDKAQAIKWRIPAVIGPEAALKPVLERGKEMESSMTLVPPVAGPYDLENAAIARAALEGLGVAEECIASGVQKCPPCRFEQRDGLILDVAHNPAGFRRLKEALESTFPGEKFHFVIGMCKDKDVESCLRVVAPIAEKIYCVAAKSVRGMPASEIGEMAAKLGLDYEVTACVSEGIERAKAATYPVVICGSFYLMEDAIGFKVYA